MLYKILNNLSPNYLRLPILTPQNRYESRSKTTNSLTSIHCRNLRFEYSFYPHTIDSWNKIDTSLKESTSLSVLKSSLIKIVRPPKKSMFGIFDHFGSRFLFQLRVGLSPLKAHKFRHNFSDTTNDICDCYIVNSFW